MYRGYWKTLHIARDIESAYQLYLFLFYSTSRLFHPHELSVLWLGQDLANMATSNNQAIDFVNEQA